MHPLKKNGIVVMTAIPGLPLRSFYNSPIAQNVHPKQQSLFPNQEAGFLYDWMTAILMNKKACFIHSKFIHQIWGRAGKCIAQCAIRFFVNFLK